MGFGFVFIAASILIFLPDSLRSRFWLYRIDLLSLPFFVAGVVTLLYGVRRLWALRVPILFLFLAWPVPYLPLVGDGLRAFTDLSVAAASALATVNPAAVPGGAEGAFIIQNAERPFVLLVGSACAGVNSMVGFLIIGMALLYIVHGSFWRKAVWLVDGLVLVWVFNVLRIEAIFSAGALFGRQVAYDILHPVAGLLVFNLAILIMLMLIPVFGLRWRPGRRGRRRQCAAQRRGGCSMHGAPGPSAWPSSSRSRPSTRGMPASTHCSATWPSHASGRSS